MINRTCALGALTAAAVLFCAASFTHAAQRYRIELIEPPTSLEPHQYLQSVGGLNNLGEVAFGYGRSIQITPTHYRGVTDSFVATKAGIQPIPDLGGDDVNVFDLTDAGVAVGGASSADTYHPSRWSNSESHYFEPFISRGGHTTVIQTPERGFSFASAANNEGIVVGSAKTVFQWSESSGYVDLGNFGATYAEVADINERGDILLTLHRDEVLQFGETYFYNGRDAVIYNDGTVSPLPRSKYGITFGSAINDHGTVVGSFHGLPGVEAHAYVWDETSGFRDLGIDGEFSYATDVNNSGIVIGSYADAYQQPETPFVFTEKDGRQRLIDLIVNLDGLSRLESATHINNRGQVAGIAYISSSYLDRRVYVATPIPEPSAFTIALGIGISANTLLCRRPCRAAFAE